MYIQTTGRGILSENMRRDISEVISEGECYTIAAWGHHAGARRHGGGREGSSFPVKTPSIFYDPSLFRLLMTSDLSFRQ